MEHGHLIFRAFESTGWLLFAAGSVVAALVLAVVLLRYELSLVPRSVGAWLLALRVSILVLLLLTLLEPVLSWRVERERQGRILVAVDVSDSMSTTDKHATPAEKLRWARALGMIGNPAVNRRLDQWVKQWEAGDEPEWVGPEETSDPQRRAELARLRKETVEGVFRELEKVSRREVALRLLTQTGSPLLQELKQVGPVELRIFAGERLSADEPTLTELLREPPASVLTDTTDLSAALAPSGTASQTAPLIGVVLFTDGRHNSGRDPLDAARVLSTAHVPVFPVLLGSKLRPRDLSIADLDYPPTVFKGDHPLLTLTVNTFGFQSQPIEVVLEKAGDESATQKKTVVATGGTLTVEFELEAEQVGRQEYTVRTDVLPGEIRDDNNQKTFALTVVDDRAHVLLVDGPPRWEFRFIHNALKRDRHVDLQSVLFDQPYVGLLPQTFFPRKLNLPDDPKQWDQSVLADRDLVIVGDVPASQLDEPAWQVLEKFVSEGGGTLVLVAGKNAFPRAHRWPVVERLLPVTNLRPFTVRTAPPDAGPRSIGFHLKLTPEGENETFLQFSADPDQNRQIWQQLPGHTWGLLGEAKPSATVLAYALRPKQAGDEEWTSLQQERRNAVLVHQHYGFGQVLWIGIDSTWRWRFRAGDQYHHRFWGQLARWAAQNKAAAGNAFVKFGPTRSDVAVDEPVILRARWDRRFLSRHPDVRVRAEIVPVDSGQPEEPIATVELTRHENLPLVFEGRISSLPAGAYQVRLVAENVDLGQDVAAPLYVHPRLTPELNDVSSNPELLQQIAQTTGGRLLLPDQVHLIPRLLQPSLSPEVTHPEVALWDHWLLLVAFFALLTAEWVLRKLNGLP